MAENENQNAGANELSPEANELSPEANERGTRKVALVRPLLRNGNTDRGRPRTLPSPPRPRPRPTSRTPSPPPNYDFVRRRSPTVPQPFSFDERDARQRRLREGRLLELRREEDRQLMATTFRANPIRRYKRVAQAPSTRPLTIPQSPFSHRHK